MADKEELLKEYKKLAKRADQRLIRLEALAHEEHYHGATSYAYARAMRDIHTWSGEGANRFNTKAPESSQQLQAKINDIKQFLEADTSTKSGITKVYKRRADTTNKKYGTNFNWQDLANFYESESNKKLAKKYGSKTVVRAIGVIKDIKGNIEKIQWAVEHNKKLGTKSEVVKDITQRLIEQGYTYDMLFK